MAPNLSKNQKVGISLALLCASEGGNGRKKRKWVKEWLKERITLSHLNVMNLLDFDDIHNFLRMEKEIFFELLEMIRPFITKQDTNMRTAVSAEERLIATLRFLATGREYRDLRYSSIVSHQLLSKIIPETCRAIYNVLKKTIKAQGQSLRFGKIEKLMTESKMIVKSRSRELPSTDEEWKETAHLFETQWQFNNCVGCMDGKHIVIQKPPGSGSLYFNYKSTFSVVLFAVVNANYEFMYVHTGSNGSQSDGGILKNTSFYEKLINNELHLPESYLLPGTDMSVPYVLLGDSAFALEKHIMKPFPERNISRDQTIFNYRLCRARRIVENAFGILASRFRVFRQPINLHLKNIDSVVLASCALHNFLRKRSKTYVTPTCVDREDLDRCSLNTGTWRQATTQLTPLQRNIQRPSSDGKQIRNTLTQYFNGEGRVSFQDRMANVIST